MRGGFSLLFYGALTLAALLGLSLASITYSSLPDEIEFEYPLYLAGREALALLKSLGSDSAEVHISVYQPVRVGDYHVRVSVVGFECRNISMQVEAGGRTLKFSGSNASLEVNVNYPFIVVNLHLTLTGPCEVFDEDSVAVVVSIGRK